MTHYLVVEWDVRTETESVLATFTDLELAERYVEDTQSSYSPEEDCVLTIEDYEVDK